MQICFSRGRGTIVAIIWIMTTTTARFVLLDHDFPQPHQDLMLEVEGGLWTWRLTEEPRPGVLQQAQRLPDHRLLYLDYEGPVSGNRGTVGRRDFGTCTWISRKNDRVVVRLAGQRLIGLMTLQESQGEFWELTFLVESDLHGGAIR